MRQSPDEIAQGSVHVADVHAARDVAARERAKERHRERPLGLLPEELGEVEVARDDRPDEEVGGVDLAVGEQLL